MVLAGTGYETDVLVVLDRTVLIIECKSASLSPQGLRGAPDRARKHVKELIAEPAAQSARLEHVISLARGRCPALEVARGLGIDPIEITTVIRISVTLDDLTILVLCKRELKAAGWIPNELELPTTLNIADLACVCGCVAPALAICGLLQAQSTSPENSRRGWLRAGLPRLYLETNSMSDRPKGTGSSLPICPRRLIATTETWKSVIRRETSAKTSCILRRRAATSRDAEAPRVDSNGDRSAKHWKHT